MSIKPFRTAFLAAVLAATSILGTGLVAPAADAAYPGGDGKIAFVRANQIYTMTANGASITKLTTSGKNYRPKWSPDGRRLSFIHEAGGRKDVWVMSAAGKAKQAVTTTGDVSSAGASWSPDGQTLAFGNGALQTIRSTAPFGTPTAQMHTFETGGDCQEPGSPPHEPTPVYVDRFVAWSPDGTQIAVKGQGDACYDDSLDILLPATGELRQVDAGGADCCGYRDWTDVFYGPSGQFGYSDRDLGSYGEVEDNPTHIVYPGFTSLDGDTGAAPSPSGAFMALTSTASGAPQIVRATVTGSARRVLTSGYQADWQPKP